MSSSLMFTSVVIPVELSQETRIPHGTSPGGWFQLGRHYPPDITTSGTGTKWKSVKLGEPCAGPLVLDFTGGYNNPWTPNLTCGLPRRMGDKHQTHHPHFFDYWDPKCKVDGWPHNELTIRLARWVFAAARRHEHQIVSVPFVLTARGCVPLACLETGFMVSVGEQTDLPVFLGLVPNEHLSKLALFAAELLLLETWEVTGSAAKEVARIRGFRS